MNVDEVVLTDTAKSKCFRMLNQNQLKQRVKQRRGEKIADSDDKYKIKTSYRNNYGDKKDIEIIVAKRKRNGKTRAVVITQKHREHASNLV